MRKLDQLHDYITNIINPYVWLMAWHFLLASNMTRATTDRVCYIALNWTLSHKFKKWCKFSICIKAKSCKKKLHEKKPACILSYRYSYYQFCIELMYSINNNLAGTKHNWAACRIIWTNENGCFLWANRRKHPFLVIHEMNKTANVSLKRSAYWTLWSRN